MRRIKLVMAVAAVMVAMMVALAAPAMADRDGFDRRGDHHGVFFNDHRFDHKFDRAFVGHDFFDHKFDRGFVSHDFFSPWGFWWCWEWSWVFEEWQWVCD